MITALARVCKARATNAECAKPGAFTFFAIATVTGNHAVMTSKHDYRFKMGSPLEVLNYPLHARKRSGDLQIVVTRYASDTDQYLFLIGRLREPKSITWNLKEAAEFVVKSTTTPHACNLAGTNPNSTNGTPWILELKDNEAVGLRAVMTEWINESMNADQGQRAKRPSSNSLPSCCT